MFSAADLYRKGDLERSAFDRVFKNSYLLTPAQALECSEIYILQEPLYFDKILDGKHLLAGTQQYKEAEVERKNLEFDRNFRFLLEMQHTVEILNRIDQNWDQHIFGIADAQTYYGLSLEQASAAFAVMQENHYFEDCEFAESFFCGTIADCFPHAAPEEILQKAELIYVMTMLGMQENLAEEFRKDWYANNCGDLNALDESTGWEYGFWYEHFCYYGYGGLFLKKVSPMDFAWLRMQLNAEELSEKREGQYALQLMLYDDVSREIALDIRRMINGKPVPPNSPVQEDEILYIMAKLQCRRSDAEEVLPYIRKITDLPIQQMDDAYLMLLPNEQITLYLFADEEDEEAGISAFPLTYTRYLALKEELLKEYRSGYHPDYMPKQLSQKEIAMLLVYIIEKMAQGETEFRSIYLDAEMNFTELYEAEQYGGTHRMLLIAQGIYAERDEDGCLYSGRIDPQKKKACMEILVRDYQEDTELNSYMDRVKIQIEDRFYNWILENLHKKRFTRYDRNVLELCVENHIDRKEAESLMQKKYTRKQLNEMKDRWVL